MFKPRAVSFIRITGTHNTANEVFHCVHFESPCDPQVLGRYLENNHLSVSQLSLSEVNISSSISSSSNSNNLNTNNTNTNINNIPIPISERM